MTQKSVRESGAQVASVLVAGRWRESHASGTFSAQAPATSESIGNFYPISKWSEIDAALDVGVTAFREMRETPRTTLAAFLRKCAELIEKRAEAICAAAEWETGLPISPRLKDVELPRTTSQLRQAADAAIDSDHLADRANIR